MFAGRFLGQDRHPGSAEPSSTRLFVLFVPIVGSLVGKGKWQFNLAPQLSLCPVDSPPARGRVPGSAGAAERRLDTHPCALYVHSGVSLGSDQSCYLLERTGKIKSLWDIFRAAGKEVLGGVQGVGLG